MTLTPWGIVGVWECVSFSRTSWKERRNMLKEHEKNALRIWKTPLRKTVYKEIQYTLCFSHFYKHVKKCIYVNLFSFQKSHPSLSGWSLSAFFFRYLIINNSSLVLSHLCYCIVRIEACLDLIQLNIHKGQDNALLNIIFLFPNRYTFLGTIISLSSNCEWKEHWVRALKL